MPMGFCGNTRSSFRRLWRGFRKPLSSGAGASRPLPFAYETTGVVTQFTNNLDPEPRSREVFTFHRPEELIRLAKMDVQLRAKLQLMPELNAAGLWDVQQEAVGNLEVSLAENRPRSLIQMATGSGKTYTACTFSYRLIKFAKAKRILFLVDRNNLGKQALNEFQQYVSPYNGMKFAGEEYVVQHLKKNTIDARHGSSVHHEPLPTRYRPRPVSSEFRGG
jgi:type I restriction enzyme R subunit